MRCPRDAGHEVAEFVLVVVAAGALADDAAGVEHEDAVAEVGQLVEVLGHQQHGGVLRRRLADPVVDELGRRDVQAPGRVVQDEEAGPVREGPRQDHALDVAAGEGGGRSRGSGRLDRVGADGLLGVPTGGRPVHEGALAEPHAALGAEHQVLHDARRRQDAVAVPVLGDVGDARLQPHGGGPPAERLAVDVHRAAIESAHPGEGLGQLDLAVAGHAGDADDLAAADLETTRRGSRARHGRCGRPGRAPPPAPARRRSRGRARRWQRFRPRHPCRP